MDEYILLNSQKSKYFSVEPHGPEGNYVLYSGRGPMQHGMNLVTLSDFDANGEATRQLIENALNTFISKEALLLRLKQLES